MKLIIHDQVDFGTHLNAGFERICQLVDEQLGFLPGMLNLVLCDDPTIQDLNRDHRGKDKVTDVLTFPYFEGETSAKDLLGEIYLDLEQARRQAEAVRAGESGLYYDFLDIDQKNWSDDFEMFKLCIHGLLHLRGLDHIEDEDFRVMKLHEDKIMKSFIQSQKN